MKEHLKLYADIYLKALVIVLTLGVFFALGSAVIYGMPRFPPPEWPINRPALEALRIMSLYGTVAVSGILATFGWFIAEDLGDNFSRQVRDV